MSQTRGPSSAGEPADDGPWLDADEAAPRLLLFAMPGLLELAASLESGAVAAVVVDPRALSPADMRAATDACRRRQVACLMRGDASAAKASGLDGVHLDDAGSIAAARAVLGSGALIGASCRLSRHAAMVAGEAGADYVMFGALTDLPGVAGELADIVAWWNELFVLPCAAAGRFDAARAAAFVQAGADLLAMQMAAGVGELARTLQVADATT